MAKLHVIVHLSLDGRIFILMRKHIDVKCVARLLPKDHKLGNILEQHLPNAMSVGKLLCWVQALGVEPSDHESVQFLTMKPSYDESSVYEYCDGLGTDPRCQVIVMGTSNHAEDFDWAIRKRMPMRFFFFLTDELFIEFWMGYVWGISYLRISGFREVVKWQWWIWESGLPEVPAALPLALQWLPGGSPLH